MQTTPQQKPKKTSLKVRFKKFEKWFKRNDGYRKIELLATIGAIVLSFYSVQLSNKTLSITQKQFELSNEPFLQIDLDIESVIYVDGWPTKIKYRLKNLGKYPVKITYGIVVSFVDSARDLSFSKAAIGESHSVQTFLTDQTKYNSVSTCFSPENDEDPTSQNYVKDIKESTQFLYLAGYFYYINLVNKQLSKYEFLFNIYKSSEYALYNKNFKVPKGTFKDEEDY